MVLPHLMLATVGSKILVVVIASRSVLMCVLMRVLGATAVLMRPRRITVASSAVVHYAGTMTVS